MSIFKSSYDTTACSGYKPRIKDFIDKLKIAKINGVLITKVIELPNFENKPNIYLITGGTPAMDAVPYFNHPIIVKDEDINSNEPLMFLDVRPYGKWNTPQEYFVVKNQPEYTWSVLRATLESIWINERQEILRDISSLPASVYSSLISESVSRKYALDANEQAIVSVISCYFYFCLFTDKQIINEFEFNRIAGSIARITRISADKVFQIIEDTKILNNLEDLCDCIKVKTNTVRLEDFNVGVLLAIVTGNWFGTNSRENLAVALEHNPTWQMICYSSISESSYKKSVLAKLVERYTKGSVGSDYVKAMDLILNRNQTLDSFNNNPGL